MGRVVGMATRQHTGGANAIVSIGGPHDAMGLVHNPPEPTAPDAHRMKIALDGYPLVPSRAGIGQYTYHLIKALARVAPVHEYVAMYPRLTRSLRMREVPVFVYHATNYVFTHAVKRARRVVTIHDLTLVVFPEWHPRARVNSMTHEIARSLEIADHILVDSAATRDDIIKHFSVRSERISAVPLAADRSFRPLPAAEIQQVLSAWGLVQDGYLLFMGKIEPRKNLPRLLQAVELAEPDRSARHRRR